MGQVTVTIADKIYRIACNDGQEPHLVQLAAELDKKIIEMRAAFGEIGDSRLTVMASITFMDEREQLRKRLAATESELAIVKDERAVIDQSINRAETEVASAIAAIAGRIGDIAQRLANAGEEEAH